MERTAIFSLNVWHTCLQTADAADDQVDLHACTGGFIQSGNDLLVTQGVDLGNDPGRTALLLHCWSPSGSSRINRFRSQIGATTSWFHFNGSEYPDNILNTAVASSPIVWIAGQKAAVCIQFCRRIVVVSGSQMNITADAVLFPAHHQCNLAVGL